MFENKALDELYQRKKQLLEFIEYAEIYGGSVNFGNKILSIEELQIKLKEVDLEIASRLSTKSYLKFIKNTKSK